MKVAFVNQPIDTILPPNQNSVGLCTYWMARALAPSADVLVYALGNNHHLQIPSDPSGIGFRFFPATRKDLLRFKMKKKLAGLFPHSEPTSTSSWLFPDYGEQVARDLQAQGCDVIHLQHCSQYAPLIRALNPGAKIVLHLHSEWFPQSDAKELNSRLQSVDLVTTVGGYVTGRIKRRFPAVRERCETIYNGIDPEEFPYEKNYGASRLRAVKRILYSGAVSPHKGLHLLMDAFVKVSQRYPRVALEVVGPIGNYPIQESFDVTDRSLFKSVAPFYVTGAWPKLKSRVFAGGNGMYLNQLRSSLPAELSDKVTFPGMFQRAELINRYYNADIFVFPPIWDEGFGLPPMEAMAAGLPVVATRSGTLPETVVDGETGILVEKNDSDELADALLVLLSNADQRERMGKAGRRRALEHFTSHRIAQQISTRYRALCSPDLSTVLVRLS
jgi:glycosyltransferase involved in cell wall biosynthesis